jgi:hypothetical protein
VLADGASARSFAEVLEPAILARTVPPVLLVGVHNAVDPASPWPDRRAQEYVPGHHRRRFDAHLGFVTDEVIPWATGHLGVAAGPWVSAGFSNGGDWAVAAAQRRSEVFAAVAAFSVGLCPSGSPAGPARPGCATTWPPAPWSRGSGRRPGSGPSGCSAPAWTAATTNGSAAMTISGGHSSSPPPWAGSSPSHEPTRRPTPPVTTNATADALAK